MVISYPFFRLIQSYPILSIAIALAIWYLVSYTLLLNVRTYKLLLVVLCKVAIAAISYCRIEIIFLSIYIHLLYPFPPTPSFSLTFTNSPHLSRYTTWQAVSVSVLAEVEVIAGPVSAGTGGGGGWRRAWLRHDE